MFKKIVYLLVFTLSVSAFSQKSDITSAIIALDNKKDLQAAKKWIDVAAEKFDNGAMLKPKFMAKYYHYRGLVYLKLFQESINSEDKNLDRFAFLRVSTESFLTDAVANSNYSKKSINQLNICSYLFQEGAYQDYENDNFKEALSKFSEAISINSSSAIQKVDTFNMYNAALMAFQANQYDKSVLWSKKLVELDPLDSRFHMRLINAYSEMGDLELKLEAIQYARVSIPESKEIIFEEVNYYLTSGQNDLLLESLDNAVKSDADNPILHHALAGTYMQLKDLEKAEKSYKQALLLDPDYFDAHNNISIIYVDKANEFRDLAMETKKDALYNKYKAKERDFLLKALPHLEACLILSPTNLEVVASLKSLYYYFDKVKEMKAMKELEGLSDSDKEVFVKDFFTQ